MRYFMPALFVALIGCSDPATSTTNDDPADAAMQDTVADLSSATDGASESDTSDNPDDMAGDTSPPDDAGNTDASLADAQLDMNEAPTDVGSRDGSAPDEGLTDAGSDATEFVCPPAKYNGEVCTQVIVYVRDQDSGTCCEYPTACHIPEGNWSDETYNSLAECSRT